MKIKKYLPIIGIAIFVYLLLKLNIFNIFNEIVNADFRFLAVAFFLVFISWTTSTLKWYIIAKKQKISVPFLSAFKINLIGIFYGFITPSRVGSVLRAEYLKKFSDGKIGKGISNYVIEKIVDAGTLLFLVLFSSFFISDSFSVNYMYYAIFGIAVVLMFIFIFSEEQRSRNIFRVFYVKIIPKRVKEMAKDGFHSFYEDMPKKRYFAMFIFINLLNWIVMYSIIYLIGLAVGVNISFFYYILFMPIVAFIGHIPITVGGLGTREASMISLFGLIGIEGTKIFSMSLINILFGIIPAIIGAILVLKYEKIK